VAVQLRIVGPLNRAVLRDSLDAMSRRHELMRTTFALVEGEAVQIIHPPSAAELEVIDASGEPDPEQLATELFRERVRHGVDPGTLPLVRFVLVAIRENEHWLLRLENHILFDVGSIDLFFRDLASIYDALLNRTGAALPPAALQYADFAVWQQRIL